jgi:hypothetical protein
VTGRRKKMEILQRIGRVVDRWIADDLTNGRERAPVILRSPDAPCTRPFLFDPHERMR